MPLCCTTRQYLPSCGCSMRSSSVCTTRLQIPCSPTKIRQWKMQYSRRYLRPTTHFALSISYRMHDEIWGHYAHKNSSSACSFFFMTWTVLRSSMMCGHPRCANSSLLLVKVDTHGARKLLSYEKNGHRRGSKIITPLGWSAHSWWSLATPLYGGSSVMACH
ncbi:hypothetical protein LINGRAHAP2_LOCUS31627 [Linum grandiflorum]